MLLSAAKGAAEILATRVARMRQEPYPTRHTVQDAPLQMRMRRHDRRERFLIGLDNRFGAVLPVPVCLKGENFLHGNGKKARLRVRMPNVLFTPSSYFIAAHASRGGARFFAALPG